MIIPAIDIMDGRVVLLEQGRIKKAELGNDPIEFAKRFAGFPEVQIVDLDAAIGNGNNIGLVKKICKIVNARVGGGFRSSEAAEELIEAGAKKIIIGTMANRKFLEKLANKIGKEKIIVAVETFNGKLMIDGQTKELEESLEEKIEETEPYCSEFLYTNIEREGLMKGVDLDNVKNLKALTNNKITVAGGISSDDEINALNKLEVDAVVGTAIYLGKLKIQRDFGITETPTKLLLPKNSGINEGMCSKIAKLKNSFKDAEFLEFRAEDIPALVEKFCSKGICTFGLTGEDLFQEYLLNNKSRLEIVEKIVWNDPSFVFGKPALCLLGPKNKKLEDFSGSIKVGINKKYERLSENYLEKLRRNGLKIETVVFSGATEQGATQGLADLCVEIVCKGGSLRGCGLAIYEKVFESDLVAIGMKEDIQKFDLEKLYEIIESKKSESEEKSFTRRLFDNKGLLLSKISEESNELIGAAKENKRSKIVWETADVLYFVSVLLSANGIMLDEVWNELRRRNYENERNKIKLG